MKKLLPGISFVFLFLIFTTSVFAQVCTTNTNSAGGAVTCPNGYTCYEGTASNIGARTSYQSCTACPVGYAQSSSTCSISDPRVQNTGACCSPCKLTEGAVCDALSSNPTQCCSGNLECGIPSGSFKEAQTVCINTQKTSCTQQTGDTCNPGSTVSNQCCASPNDCIVHGQDALGTCQNIAPTSYPTPTPTATPKQGSCPNSIQYCETNNLQGAKPGNTCSIPNYVFSQTIQYNKAFAVSCNVSGSNGFCCEPLTPTPAPTETPVPPPPPCLTDTNGNCYAVGTGFGAVSIDVSSFIGSLFSILLSFSGGVILLVIIFAGYRLMSSQGDPEKIKTAREMLTAGVIGLLFVIFSVTILRIIGVDILHIPGLSFK